MGRTVKPQFKLGNMMLETILILLGVLAAMIVSFGTGVEFHKIREGRKSLVVAETSQPVPEFADVIEGKRFSTLDAKCIAQGNSLLGWVWLMRTSHDNFFVVMSTPLGLTLGPRTQEQAIQFFTQAPKREVKFEEAFPGVKVVDA